MDNGSKSEDTIQRETVFLLEKLFPQIFVFSNLQGIAIKGKNKYSTIARQKALGNKAGVSDLTVMLPEGKVLWVEMKTNSGQQHDSQLMFEQICKNLGHEYFIVKDKITAVAIVLKELNLDISYFDNIDLKGKEVLIERIKDC